MMERQTQATTNTISSLIVEKSGAMSLIQDFGRYGLSHLGITQGGPVDDFAYSWVNHILGNPVNCSVIEITLGQAQFVANSDCELAIGGGDLRAAVEGRPIRNWSNFIVRKGQRLTFSIARNGLRAYLAVKGGFQFEPHLLSTSCVQRDSLGGVNQDGGALESGQTLPFVSHSTLHHQARHLTFRFTPDYNLPLTLRVIETYQADEFDEQAKETFYHSEFTIDPNSNRMGYRLSGDSVTPPNEGILSEGIALGSIQVPPDGQPIILLNDRQTIGGYPKIGCIARIDLPRLAQAKPGQKVRFVKGDREGLQDVWCQWARFFGY